MDEQKIKYSKKWNIKNKYSKNKILKKLMIKKQNVKNKYFKN